MRDLAIECQWVGAQGGAPAQTATGWAVVNSCLAIACWHAPRPLVHRIHVFPLQPLQAWTSLHLADAARCSLRRLRSTSSPTGRVLGFFPDSFALTLTMVAPHCGVAATASVLSLAPFHHCPVGLTGGASSAARTATPPAAMATRAIGHGAGTPGHQCTATRSSTWTPTV